MDRNSCLASPHTSVYVHPCFLPCFPSRSFCAPAGWHACSHPLSPLALIAPRRRRCLIGGLLAAAARGLSLMVSVRMYARLPPGCGALIVPCCLACGITCDQSALCPPLRFPMRFPTIYSWITHQMHIGTTLAFLLSRSNFKSETSFGFLSPNYMGNVT